MFVSSQLTSTKHLLLQHQLRNLYGRKKMLGGCCVCRDNECSVSGKGQEEAFPGEFVPTSIPDYVPPAGAPCVLVIVRRHFRTYLAITYYAREVECNVGHLLFIDGQPRPLPPA